MWTFIALLLLWSVVQFSGVVLFHTWKTKKGVRFTREETNILAKTAGPLVWLFELEAMFK